MPEKVPAPSCKLCGQPMYYASAGPGLFTFHTDTDEYLCEEEED